MTDAENKRLRQALAQNNLSLGLTLPHIAAKTAASQRSGCFFCVGIRP